MTSKHNIAYPPAIRSRKAIMDALAIGESVIFTGESGGKMQALQASVNATYRQPQTFGGQGLQQTGGLMHFEGELPTPVTRVTRVADPE